MTTPSKELLSEVLGLDAEDHIVINNNDLVYAVKENEIVDIRAINIYELMHMNLKNWAKINNCFDIIDWSGEPDEIISKANKIYDELN